MSEQTALTPQEVADLLKITKNTVYELIKRGELNSYKVGNKIRVDISDVNAYKNKDRVPAGGQTTGQDLIRPLRQELVSYAESIHPGGFVICGQDIILDILSRYLEMHPNGTKNLRSYVGSYSGLYALYNGNASLATAHLWDSQTNEYNLNYVRYMMPGTRAVLVNLAWREQGFYVQKGNPKGITGWEDLRREDIVMINREKGSGTRVLLDEHLKQLSISGNAIRGYERESSSHLAVASTVARGGADLGMGNEKAGLQVRVIDFIPLQKERYDLVIREEDLVKHPYQAVLQILNSREFREELEGIGGYDLTDLGKIIAST